MRGPKSVRKYLGAITERECLGDKLIVGLCRVEIRIRLPIEARRGRDYNPHSNQLFLEHEREARLKRRLLDKLQRETGPVAPPLICARLMFVEFLNNAWCDHHIDGLYAGEKVFPRDVLQVVHLKKSVCVRKQYFSFTSHPP